VDSELEASVKKERKKMRRLEKGAKKEGKEGNDSEFS